MSMTPQQEYAVRLWQEASALRQFRSWRALTAILMIESDSAIMSRSEDLLEMMKSRAIELYPGVESHCETCVGTRVVTVIHSATKHQVPCPTCQGGSK